MRKFVCLIFFATLTAACGGGGSPAGNSGPQAGTGACSVDGQKQFVLDTLYDWYLWNDLLPANINIADYASAEQLVFEVTTTFGPQDGGGNPIDLFSGVNSLQADTEFFGEGKFEGFGFSWRFVDPARTDFRISRTFFDSPANRGGLARGQRVLSLNGRTVDSIDGAEGISAFFDANTTVTFEVQPLTGANFTSAITKDVVTIDPVPRTRIIDAGGGRNVGYLELSSFISTADPLLADAFTEFRNANVSEVILDLRYNGGGLVSTAEFLGDLLGGSVAQNLIFSSTEYNADRANNNRQKFFGLLSSSINLSRLVVVASRGTASASELVTNGMIPHVDVAIVGDRTFGKPVGQSGFEFCEKLLRPTTFQIANADGVGDYFDGLPVDCPAPDDLTTLVGDDDDPNVIAALTYLNTGSCPVVSLPFESQKSSALDVSSAQQKQDERRRTPLPPHRELLDAY